ncbi:MAG: excinuclease [Nostocales cyanobacterium]|nr:MAG: excinuclease [Nostocales cyanobacterium]
MNEYVISLNQDYYNESSISDRFSKVIKRRLVEESLHLYPYLLDFLQYKPIEKSPEWLENIINYTDIHLIESQRLLNISEDNEMIPSVNAYANELADNIQEKLAEYGTLSQSLDRTFPVRLVQKVSTNSLTNDQLIKKLDEVETKRKHLINAGLLDKDENTNFQISEQIDENIKQVLSVYIEDVENKLTVFDNLSQRIELMKKIINQRFAYKEINISKEKGFTFTCNGNSLSPTQLSSGEQHELVILYELLFKVKPNSLILIDEPELSLHVEWQVNFLKDLQEITQIANVDVLIATHSPGIIHDRWDLTVELKGPHR